MCLITFSYKNHLNYELILAGNRDEFYGRPTRKAQFWTEENYPDILAGKDLEGGGTWLGVHRNGRWATLTNYRDMTEIKENAPTRGTLVLNFLKNKLSAKEYLEQLAPKADLYNGFNLLLSDDSGIYHYSNHTHKINRVSPGVHGLSNALLDTPWPKTTRAKSGLNKVIQDENIDKEALFKILADEEVAPQNVLPDTGLSKEMERAVSPIFIKTKDYGSRCSTVLLIDKEGNIDFTERRFEPGTKNIAGESHYLL